MLDKSLLEADIEAIFPAIQQQEDPQLAAKLFATLMADAVYKWLTDSEIAVSGQLNGEGVSGNLNLN